MTWYAHRRNGVIASLHREAQTGYAEEELADDHVDVVAYLAPERAKARLLAIGTQLATRLKLGVTYGGKAYQLDDVSQSRIQARALFARSCLDGNETWPEDFGWIASDNTRPTFTAQQFWDFAKAAQDRVTALVLHARVLKDDPQLNPAEGWP